MEQLNVVNNNPFQPFYNMGSIDSTQKADNDLVTGDNSNITSEKNTVILSI